MRETRIVSSVNTHFIHSSLFSKIKKVKKKYSDTKNSTVINHFFGSATHFWNVKEDEEKNHLNLKFFVIKHKKKIVMKGVGCKKTINSGEVSFVNFRIRTYNFWIISILVIFYSLIIWFKSRIKSIKNKLNHSRLKCPRPFSKSSFYSFQKPAKYKKSDCEGF